jgi:hypothetical protein
MPKSKSFEAVNTHDNVQRFLTADWLITVAKTRDTELRCHRIALTYSRFAAYLDTWLFEDKSYWYGQLRGEPTTSTNANWFHFSTWAALTVSRNIGSIAAPQRFDGWPNVARQAISPYLVRARGTDHQQVSQALASAQLTIFINTCVAFLDCFEGEEAQAATRRLDVDENARRLACQGFSYYQKAQKTADALQERYVLLANVLSTVIEQHLIDGQLEAMITAVPTRLSETAEGRISQAVERLMGVQRQVTELTLVNRLESARAAATTVWARLLTDQVFVMCLPGEMLRLGRDIPPLKRNQPYYPTNLRRPERFVDDKQTCEQNDDMSLLRALLVRFDRTVGDGRGSAARDWRRYDERMNWALTLLRSRQHDATMFWPPYSEEDEHRIYEGRLPHRSGDATQIIAPLNNQFVCDEGGHNGLDA